MSPTHAVVHIRFGNKLLSTYKLLELRHSNINVNYSNINVILHRYEYVAINSIKLKVRHLRYAVLDFNYID